MTQGFPDAAFLAFAITEKREQLKTANAQETHRLPIEIRGLERLLQQQESNDYVKSDDRRDESAAA